MITRLTLVILGLFHTANGAWMVLAPMSWYAAVPGVAESGPLNHHFVADIGLAFIASGAGLVFGARTGAGAFALAGATWPVLHALLHMWGWLQHGFPAHTDVGLSEAVGVVLVGAAGALAAWRNARKEGAT
jgi:hypothetical protein